ncbi:hypothetical protein KKC32_00430 [Patescibacteria group bacterium]|nr:hypothetical protein [Patescibacteria group bacterium]
MPDGAQNDSENPERQDYEESDEVQDSSNNAVSDGGHDVSLAEHYQKAMGQETDAKDSHGELDEQI